MKTKFILILSLLVSNLGFTQNNTENADTYRIIAIKKNYNHIESISNTVEIKRTPNFYIPNAFTPNYDGLNDEFKVVGNGVTEFYMEIYNRWGELIFKTSDINHGWDGKFNNNDAQQGIYKYFVKAKTENAKVDYSHAGEIALIR
jgi:gliding motility-associated-like protein